MTVPTTPPGPAQAPTPGARDPNGRAIHVSRTWRWPFYVAIAALLVCGGLALVQYSRFAGAATEVERSTNVLDALEQIQTRLVDAESGLRGHLLTGEAPFLHTLSGVDADTRALVARLEDLSHTDPERLANLRRLDELTRDKVREMAGILARFEAGDVAGATSAVAASGKRVMDDIREVAAAMRAAEQARLAERSGQAALARRSGLGFALVTLLLAVGLALVANSVNRHFERRRLAYTRELEARRTAERSVLATAEELRQSELKFRTIADSLPQIVWSTRADGYHDYFNERWFEYTGMRRHGAAGGTQDQGEPEQGWEWTSFLHPDDVGPTLTAWRHSLETGAPYHVEYRLRRFDGTYRWFIGRALPMHDGTGTLTRWFGSSTDIEDQKRADEQRNRLLASERAARSEAEHAARMKDEFVSTLSHELRTPLNAILGWVGVLKHDHGPETLAKAVDVIDRNSRRQSQMIDDLLDISRIVAGKMRLDVQRVDLTSVIEEAVASAQPAADARGVRLVKVLGSAAIIQGDPGRLQQVVWNLVSNAIKFTPRGGMVQVTLRKVNSHVHVQVSDTGQGIRADLLPHVFQRFLQADSRPTRSQGGLGLGLAIVKNLVEMHGGTVEAASEGEGSGSVFTVRLPIALATHAGEPPRPDTLEMVPARFATLLTGLRVLVLDDEPDARDLVERLLADAGAVVSTAASAQEAIDHLNAGFEPHIIVSDIGMPVEDGYDFMHRVRRLESPVAAVPAAALTALARVEDRKRALMAGYQAHLAKPVDPAELVAMVASLTGRTGRRSPS